ncbi:MAG: CSLREA domain-containing protein [Rhodanobacteraceae bacterium]|nr:CSLREA domain-containing protein [Rhodanobacteraceae bacterium]
MTVNGGFAPGGLEIGESATVALDTPGAVALPLLSIDQGALSGNDEVRVSNAMIWDGGAVVGSGASPGPLVIEAGATLGINFPAHVLDSRTLQIDGAATWHSGAIRVPQNQSARIAIGATGMLVTATFKTTAFFGCDIAPCMAEMDVAGLLRNIGSAADFQLTSPLQVNGGTLRVENDSFTASAIDLNAGTVEVIAPGTLETGILTLNGGVLRGTGLIDGDVNNVGGEVRPGTSPGQLDILGAYTQGPGGTLQIEVGGLVPGSSSDFVFASGTVNLDGTLDVIDVGYTLTAPQTLDVLMGDIGINGTFATSNIPYPGYTVSYSAFAATLVPGGPISLVVNSTADPGDGNCDVSECTLREAIAAANLMPDPDVIEFAIPALQCTGPGGSCVIVPGSSLPAITGPVLIDGYSQSGAVPNSHPMSLGLGNNAIVMIELDGAVAGGDGLLVNAPSLSLVGIHGLSLYRWNTAISVQGPLDSNQIIGGNFIGLRADGSVAAPIQGLGVAVAGGHPQIGGGLAPDMNVIGGNVTGVQFIAISPGSGVLVQGNLIGTAPNGLATRPNQIGILAQTTSALPGIVIGGNQPDQRNLVSGNTDDAIRFDCSAISGACFDGAQVLGNFIGPAIDGTPLGNGGDGIDIAQMSDGLLAIGGFSAGEGNRIAFNVGDGIRATGFAGIARATFLRNDIYLNGGLGIDLGGDGRTANDVGDVDTGPNGLLNFPEFTSYTAPGGTSAVIDVLLDTPDIGGNYPARVDFYKAVEDEPGVWLGTTTCAQPAVTCPASFAFPGGVTVAPDDVVVGVVTDGFGKSSEASFYATTTVVTAPDAVLGSSYAASVTVTSSAPFSILGDVNVNDGLTESCMATLSVVGPGQSTGSCNLNAVLPLGPRTITASYAPEAPPPRPFADSDGTDTSLIFAGVPSIASISPTSGPDTGGTVVTITGSDFLVGGTSIDFGLIPATGVSCTPTICTATSPAGSGTVRVRATTVGGTSADTPADDFSYIASTFPTTTTITGIAPPGGVVVGQPYTVSVLVTATPLRGSPVSFGTVEVRQLSDGTSCTIDLSLATSCSLTPTSALTTAVRAYYLGSGSLLPSQSSAQAYPVSRADTAIQIVSDTPDPSLVGEPVLVTVSLGWCRRVAVRRPARCW